MAAGGISGVAVGIAAVGGLLVYAGFRGVSPLDALRDVSSGKPAGLPVQTSSGAPGFGAGTGGVAQTSLPSGSVSGPHPEIVAGAMRYAGDRYSELMRDQPGYSDCSSFVGKALRAAGISPPAGSTTLSYLTWRALTQVPQSAIGAGDLLVSPAHMAIAINSTTAIGQQNGSVNVQIGPIGQLMWGQSWTALRYTGGASQAGAGSVMA